MAFFSPFLANILFRIRCNPPFKERMKWNLFSIFHCFSLFVIECLNTVVRIALKLIWKLSELEVYRVISGFSFFGKVSDGTLRIVGKRAGFRLIWDKCPFIVKRMEGALSSAQFLLLLLVFFLFFFFCSSCQLHVAKFLIGCYSRRRVFELIPVPKLKWTFRWLLP